MTSRLLKDSPAASIVLVVAGSDSSGGAGIAQDIRALQHTGAEVRLALTAVTTQTADGVARIDPVPVEGLVAQLDAAGHVDAVKLGMLADAERVQVVTAWLAEREVPVVCDPVMRSTSGGTLLDAGGVEALWALMDHLALITPNGDEAAALAGEEDWQDWAEAAPCPVLVTGGDADDADEVLDVLFIEEEAVEYGHPRIPGTHRGTGCALSTLIAAWLGRGRPVEEAIGEAIQDLEELLAGKTLS